MTLPHGCGSTDMEVPVHNPLSPVRRRVAVGAVAAAALAPGGVAQAASPCPKESASQVFATWGDSANYYLAPDGAFEGGGDGWLFTGGARVVRGSEPFALAGPAGRRALALPAGSTATSPPFCVRPDARIVRWVQRAPRGAALDVEVVHLDPAAALPGRRLRTVRGGGWRPSPRVAIPLAGAGGSADGSTVVALKFTALAGRWSIDSLFVDPRLKR